MYYTMAGTVEVQANSMEKAIEIVRDEDEVIPLPDNADYLDGSWEVSDLSPEEIRELYNGKQKDVCC